MKFFAVVGALVFVVGCGENLGSPSAVPDPATTSPLASVQACSIQLVVDVNMSGPILLIETDSVIKEVEIQEKKEANGTWKHYKKVSGPSNKVPVTFFEHWYNVRVLAEGCSDWSQWVAKEVGPANPGVSGTIPPMPSPEPPNTPPPTTPNPPRIPTLIASVCFTKPLVANNSAQREYTERVSVPAGVSEIKAEIWDKNHRSGYQSDQTHEMAEVWGILAAGGEAHLGTTGDLPEKDESKLFDLGSRQHGTLSAIRVRHAFPGSNPNSIHKTCVYFYQ